MHLWSKRIASSLLFLALADTLSPTQANEECTRIDFLFDPFKIDQNPVRGACAGNGVCNNGICFCEAGFSGKADFFDASGASCQTNIALGRGLWGFTLTVTMIYIIISIPRIRLRWRTFQETKAMKLAQGTPYHILHNRGLLAIISAFGVCMPAVVIMAIVRIAAPDMKIGLDALPTFLYLIAKIGFYMAVYFFQPALIASVLHGNRATRWIVQVNYRVNLVITSLGIFSGIVPFICLGISNGDDSAALGAYMGTQFSTFLQVIVLGVQAAWTKNHVKRALNASLSVNANRRTEEIKARLVAVENENIVQTVGQGIIFALMMLIPTLMLAHSEFLAISWCAYGILSKKIAYTAVSDSRYGSKSAGSSSKSDAWSKDNSSFKGETRLTTTTNVATMSPGSVVTPPSSPRPHKYQQSTIQRRFEDNVLSFHEVSQTQEPHNKDHRSGSGKSDDSNSENESDDDDGYV